MRSAELETSLERLGEVSLVLTTHVAQREPKGRFVKKTKPLAEADLQPEYRREDLGKCVRGKYLAAYQRGSNRVLLNPDIAKAFPSSEAVNQALRALLSLTDQTTKLTRRSKPRSAKRATHP